MLASPLEPEAVSDSAAYDSSSLGQYLPSRALLAKMSAQTMRPFTATTTPTAFWFRSCWITLSYDFCMGPVIESICCLTAEFSMVLAYEVVLFSSTGPPPVKTCSCPFTDGEGAALIAKADLADATSSHTFCWFASTIALLRTLGCAITDACVSNFVELATHRPGSTQKTERSTGSLSAGTMRSLAKTRSCFPPVTTSPASRISGRLELFTSTRRFTSAPRRYCGGKGLRRRFMPGTAPTSVTTTSPERMPSSRVMKPLVSCDLAETTGKMVRSPCEIGDKRLYPSGAGAVSAGSPGSAMAPRNNTGANRKVPQKIRFFMQSSSQPASPRITLENGKMRPSCG